MARPTKLTNAVQAKICSYLAQGVHVSVAAAHQGVCAKTVSNWIQRGIRDGKGRFHAFAVAVRQAEAMFEIRCQLTIAKAGQTDWKAAAWQLERRVPDRYGPRKPQEAEQFDAMEKARMLREAVRLMDASVPRCPPPAAVG